MEPQIGEGAPDKFTVPKDEVYASDMQIDSWRSTLTTGFNLGLAPFFTKASGTDTDLVLKIEMTEIYFDDKSSDMAVGPSGSVQRITIHCNLIYQAFLLDGDGKVLRKRFATVRHKSGDRNRPKMVEGSVARMFEEIAHGFFMETS